jgi:microcystin-dependent protein
MADTPILGCIYMFAGNFAIRGYQMCNGQILSIAQNTALFSILGTTYGGNGQTTFALPDLRGRAPVHQGTGNGLSPVDLGEITGAQSVTLTVAEMPAHTHVPTVTVAVNGASARPTADTPAGNLLATTGQTNIYAPGTSTPLAPLAAQAATVTAQNSVTGGSQPVSTQSPILGVTFLIATEGIFPARN